MPTFGETNKGTGMGSINNRISGTVFTCPENGYATSITVCVTSFLSNIFKAHCGLYDYTTMALLGETVELVGPLADGPQQFDFPTPVQLTANTKYVLVIIGNQGIQIAFFVDYTSPSLILDQTYGSLPAILTGAWIAWRFSIYCTYQTAAPPSQYQLTIVAGAGGTTDPAPAVYGSYPAGSQETVTAIPATGYLLDHWTLDGANVGSTNPAVITMNSDHMLVAVFVLQLPPNYNLTVNSTPIQGVPFTVEKVT
jgi:hypothetical protein